VKNNDFSILLTSFLSKYLPGQRNLSNNTIISYRDNFKLFLTYCSNVKKYIQDLDAGRPPRAGEERLSMEQLMIEAIYLGLRQTKGIFIDIFDKKFGVSFEIMFEDTIELLESKGLIEVSQNRCALTCKGMLYLDSIASMFI